jgi:F-type H+-transporting ATPase subunit b
LEASACEVFTQRLRALAGADRDTLAAAFKSTDNCALVRSAFALAPPQRAAIQKAVNETFSIAASLQFDTAPELVGGIELSAHGQKFAWSISDYLASMERGVTELLTAPAGTVPAPSMT